MQTQRDESGRSYVVLYCVVLSRYVQNLLRLLMPVSRAGLRHAYLSWIKKATYVDGVHSKKINKQTIFLWIFLLATFPAAYSQHPIITSPLSDELQGLCPGQLRFTCITRGSPIIAWTSDDYIGPGSTQLEFGAINLVGQTDKSPNVPTTVATLTGKGTADGDTQILESQLEIIASQEYPNSTVTCINVGNGMRSVINFSVLADPGLPPANVRSHVQRNQTGECIVTLLWDVPNDVGADDLSHFRIEINEQENFTASSTMATYCNCDPHNISISSVNRCNRAGPSINTPTLNPDTMPLAMSCQEASTTSTVTIAKVTTVIVTDADTTNSELEIKCEALCVYTLIGIIGVLALVIFILVMLMILCCRCTPIRKKKNGDHDTEEFNGPKKEDNQKNKQETSSINRSGSVRKSSFVKQRGSEQSEMGDGKMKTAEYDKMEDEKRDSQL